MYKIVNNINPSRNGRGIQKFDFLKSGSMVAGLTKAFLGVGSNQKELSFSDHTHNLIDLDGILTADKGGTGVSSLGALKTALGISGSSSYYITTVSGSGYNSVSVPENWRLYIALGSAIEFGYCHASGDVYSEIAITEAGSSIAKIAFDHNRTHYSDSIVLNGRNTAIVIVFY